MFVVYGQCGKNPSVLQASEISLDGVMNLVNKKMQFATSEEFDHAGCMERRKAAGLNH